MVGGSRLPPQQQQQQQNFAKTQQQSVLENLISQPAAGHYSQQSPMHSQQSPMNSQQLPDSSSAGTSDVYDQKLQALKPHCENLRMRATTCRMEGNLDAAVKLETMLSVLEKKRVVSLEYLVGLESWIHRKADFLVRSHLS